MFLQNPCFTTTSRVKRKVFLFLGQTCLDDLTLLNDILLLDKFTCGLVVRVFKSSDLPPWERVQPTEARKLRVVNRKVYKPIPELEELKQEIGSYRP
ncbi:uncharacterized protein LOC143278112 isoform X2 [Babylonia areolata]|uniref:uncharacterized protein LOC143278112 isoform X2 n=1 Tax=Babylonia areolata TaxID=304850 RepID=UPI003FD635D9